MSELHDIYLLMVALSEYLFKDQLEELLVFTEVYTLRLKCITIDQSELVLEMSPDLV